MRSRPGAARLLLVALAAPLAAAPAVAQPWTEPDPAAVVGQWRGPVRWQRCAIDGAPRVALAVGRDGSGYQIDLAALADGWGVEAMAPLGGDLLEVDVCRSHGTFFDAGELPRIIEFVMQGGLEAAERAELQRLRDQARRELQSAQYAAITESRSSTHANEHSGRSGAVVIELLASLLR